MKSSSPLGTVGAMAIILISGEAYVVRREPDALNLCMSPLPETLFGDAVSKGPESMEAIGNWLASEKRVFIMVRENATLSVVEMSPRLLTTLSGIDFGIGRYLTQDEVLESSSEAGVLVVQGMMLGADVFPKWAENDSVKELNHLAPNYVEFGAGGGMAEA